jgi:hypothetical protein
VRSACGLLSYKQPQLHPVLFVGERHAESRAHELDKAVAHETKNLETSFDNNSGFQCLILSKHRFFYKSSSKMKLSSSELVDVALLEKSSFSPESLSVPVPLFPSPPTFAVRLSSCVP